ncbi:MAG TPA: methyltransferase type 12 [Gammaproteobacteria bacterium]|nr:methyltransferase type 12 [Gammaproteobacteria bacterium]
MTKAKLDDTGKTVFDNIYTSPDPRAYCAAMQGLDYVIPERAQPIFSDLFHTYQHYYQRPQVNVLDLGSSYGINAALLRYAMTLPDLYARYTSDSAQALSTDALLERDRQDYADIRDHANLHMTGMDISAPALHYGRASGLLQDTVEANLEVDAPTPAQAQSLARTDCLISSGCFGYVTTTTLEKIIAACQPRKPWMAHCVLRMFPLDTLSSMLQDHGYRVQIHATLVPQRRFASAEEQQEVITRLQALDIDPRGWEDQGWLYAHVITAKHDGSIPR